MKFQLVLKLALPDEIISDINENKVNHKLSA